MRLYLLMLLVLTACPRGGGAYQMQIREAYEVGEDITIGVGVKETSSKDAVLIITRPDGSTLRQRVTLDKEQTQVRFSKPVDKDHEPTFNDKGDYKVELKAGKGTAVLAQQQIRVAVDRLTKKFDDEEVGGFAPLARFTRVRMYKDKRWKTYHALYEHTLRDGVQITVVIEEPGDALQDAWKQYVETSTLGVIEGNNVQFQERTGSVTASWISGKRIISMRANELPDLEKGFIAHFLAKYPSNLKEG